jgi:signal transduction histidine kinase
MYPTNRGLYPHSNPNGAFALPGAFLPPHAEEPAVQPIRTFRLLSTSRPSVAAVRGAVVLTTPKLFVQDATGGVEVEMDKSTPLKVGDQVELGGIVYPGIFRSVLRKATLYSVGTPAPTPPLSVTADQAATGSFDAMLIEIEGRLMDKQLGPQDTLRLDLSAGNQQFSATLNSSQAGQLSRSLEMGSTLRLRGICLVDSTYTHNTIPFALLIRSYGGIDVVAGPPWWTTNHLLGIAAGLVALLFLGTLFYSRAEQWRLRAVLRERERLAHEIHDTLAQSFAGIGFQLRAIRKRLTRETIDAAALLQQVDLASELVRHSHDEARRSIAALRQESIPATGLLAALEECARRMVDRGAVTIEAVENGEPFPLPLRTLDGLFRIGQEAIANAIQHGHPNRLSIIATYSKNQIQLIVEDNGKGFPGDTESDGFGLIGMRRRAERLNGTLDIKSGLDEGTRVTITAPVPPRFILDDWLSRNEK